jgi:predicted ATPase
MKPLKAITIYGYKSIRELDALVLRPLNVLIGANGVGKSNFISLFKLLNEIINRNLQVYVGKAGGSDTQLYFGQKVTGEIHIRLDFAPNGYEIILTPTANDSLIIKQEVGWFHGSSYPQPYRDVLSAGIEESKLAEKAQRGNAISSHILSSLSSWKLYHFHDTSESAKVKLTGDIDDNNFFRPDASNLAAFLFLLREKQFPYYQRIIETIRLVAPFFDDFQLNPSQRNEEKIRLEWKERGSDTYFNAHSLSDGTLRFMCLTTLLLQPSLPATILLDEPELGLHPYALSVLAGLLKSAATKTQIIVSTQSVQLVNEFDPEDLIVVEREDNQSVFKKLDAIEIKSWLEDYKLGELWETNLIGGRP